MDEKERIEPAVLDDHSTAMVGKFTGILLQTLLNSGVIFLSRAYDLTYTFPGNQALLNPICLADFEAIKRDG